MKASLSIGKKVDIDDKKVNLNNYQQYTQPTDQNQRRANLNYKTVLGNTAQMSNNSMLLEQKDIFKKQHARNFSDIDQLKANLSMIRKQIPVIEERGSRYVYNTANCSPANQSPNLSPDRNNIDISRVEIAPPTINFDKMTFSPRQV